MKKFIQICSLFILAVAFMATSASAQSGFGSEVEIPFAFNVGDHSYEAGNYIFKLKRYAPGSASLLIQDTKTDEVQSVLVHSNGDEPAAEIKLVFDSFEGQRYLTKIRTPDRTFALSKSKAEKNAARARDAARSETSSIGSGANPF